MSSLPPTPPRHAPPAVPETAAVWTRSLWGLTSPRAELLATLATVAVLAASRFALLPSGPWDWDETLFARGILEFDLPGHYPHPPGFPLWMLLGWLANAFVSEPLVGLQLLSAAASCLTLWPLAALGRRVASPPVAAAAALLMLFAPGVWLHAGRGFSSTPAAFFALWAAALALRPADRRPVTAFTCLVTAAFLIRPILLPSLGLLWLAGVWRVTPRRRLLPGVMMAAGATLVAVAGMVLAQGSWSEFVRPFVVHGRTHARNLLGNTGGFAELGIVKGLGGPALACLLAALATIGLVLWMRRLGRGAAIAWIAVVGIGIGELIWLQNRTFSRYAVPFQIAAAPLVAGAAALAPPALGTGVLLAAAASLAARGFPPLAEQHTRLMPGWEALRFAADTAARDGYDLVVEPGLFPFLSYLAHSERAAGREWPFQAYLAPSSPDSRGLPRRRYLLVTDLPASYLPAPWERRWTWGDVSGDLRPLTSGRFLDASVVEGAIVPVRDWWPAERSGAEAFMWGGAQAELLLPPLALDAPLALDLLPARGDAPLAVRLNDADVAVIPGDAPRLSLPLNQAMFSASAANRLVVQRERGYPPGGGDSRPLAVRLFGLTPLGDDAFVAARDRMTALLAAADPAHHPNFPTTGFYRPESFPRGRGAWTQPLATLDLPLASGVLTLTLWAPRPGPVDLHVRIDGEPVAGPLTIGRDPQDVSLVLTNTSERDGPFRVALHSRAYRPAGASSGDTRELGVVVASAQFTPAHPGGRGWIAVPDRAGSSLLWAAVAAVRAAGPDVAAGWRRLASGNQEYLRGSEGALMPLPAAGSTERFLLEISVPSSAVAAIVEIDAKPAAILLPGTPRMVLELPAAPRSGGESSLLTVRRARRGPGEVAVNLHSIAVRRSDEAWEGPVAHALERARLGVRLESSATSSNPLRASGLHSVERFPAGAGAWTFPEAELVLPAAGGALRLTLASPRPTSPELEVLLSGQPVAGPLAVTTQPQELLVTLPSPTSSGTSTVRVGLRAAAYSPATRGAADSRELGVVLFGGELQATPGHTVARWTLTPPDTGSTWTITTIRRGAYNPERFGELNGCWIVPAANLSVPPGTGTLAITAWAARPVPSRFEVWRDGRRVIGPEDLPNRPTHLEIPIRVESPEAREVMLELRAAPYSPRRHHGARDDRELGIVLGHLAFRPGG